MSDTRSARLRAVHRPSGFAGVLVAVGLFLFGGVMLTTVLAVGIWPGEVKLVAPLFCDGGQPDAFVVSDTYSSSPGETTTNFTLYCMGPSGDATDHGFLSPFLATVALNTGLLVLLSLFFALIRRLRVRRPSTDLDGGFDERLLGPASTSGPFVD